jgi:hypothetical protein
VRLLPDTNRLPLRLSFPEGNLIGLAKDKLPVDVCFSSSRPLSFTAMLDFLDESGRTFSLPVTGAADSCSLTHEPFMQVMLFGQVSYLLNMKQQLYNLDMCRLQGARLFCRTSAAAFCWLSYFVRSRVGMLVL